MRNTISAEKITPDFIEAFKAYAKGSMKVNWDWDGYSADNDEGFFETPKMERSRRNKLRTVIEQLYSDFSKEHPWYHVDKELFFSAFAFHPVYLKIGLRREYDAHGIIKDNKDEIVKLYTDLFNGICELSVLNNR